MGGNLFKTLTPVMSVLGNYKNRNFSTKTGDVLFGKVRAGQVWVHIKLCEMQNCPLSIFTEQLNNLMYN